MRKIDNAQQAEDDGQSETEHGVKGAIDQAQQQLAQKCLMGNTENFHGDPSVHARGNRNNKKVKAMVAARLRGRPPGYQLTS
jgi:hypothetical protein